MLIELIWGLAILRRDCKALCSTVIFLIMYPMFNSLLFMLLLSCAFLVKWLLDILKQEIHFAQLSNITYKIMA